jgi:hypothetical protein
MATLAVKKSASPASPTLFDLSRGVGPKVLGLVRGAMLEVPCL